MSWLARLWDHGHSRFSGAVVLTMLLVMGITAGLAGLETFFWLLDRRRRHPSDDGDEQ